MYNIAQNPGDSNVYLHVDGRWYRYDTAACPIGSGAMGTVYMGFSCDTNEPVAVKLIHPHICDIPNIRQRAKLEASVRLDCPNVVKMIGYCENFPDSGPLYVLSKYISGVTFDEHVCSQLSSLDADDRTAKIVEEFIQILDAVAVLHSNGIVHRDIKPSNIMLQDGYLPVLMDLGVVKTNYFFDAHICGTVGSQPFAAPEQIVPDDVEAKVDSRSDIYSLGMTLSHLISCGNQAGESNCPETLQSIIERATDRNPDGRYPDVWQFREDLESYLHQEEKPSGNALKYCIAGAVALLLLLTLIFYRYVFTY